jgi:Protein of unknown function (DUF2867)
LLPCAGKQVSDCVRLPGVAACQLLEVINRAVHGAALSTLVETADTYRFYFGVYVRSVSRFTPLYMRVIDPVRKLVAYPSLLRTVRTTWDQAFGTA